MRLDFLESHNRLDAPLQRLDTRLKLIFTFAFLICVFATPIGSWRMLVAEGLFLAFIIGVSGVPPTSLLRRWTGFLVLFGFLTAMVAPSRPEAASQGVVVVAVSILAKDSLAFLATLLLVQVTPFRLLLNAFASLGMPKALVATLHFMYRYLFVFAEELDRMTLARRSRTFRRSGRLDWGLLTGLIGVLFLRSIERGERVHQAMLARGWDGHLRGLD